MICESIRFKSIFGKRILYLFFILSSLQVLSQRANAVLSGKVTDSSTGASLASATVYVEELEKGAVTDNNGEFRIELPHSTYTIAISFSGYSVQHIEIILTENLFLEISLTESAVDLDEVVVTGASDNNVGGLNIGLKTMKVEEIKALPTFLGQTDVIKTLLLLPGVSTVGEGASGFNVRGGKVGQNLVLYNGAPLFNSSHILGLFSSFNTDALESFDLYKGHIPARFGGRLSSVLDINARDGDYDNHKLKASIGLLTGSVLLEGPISKGSTSFLVSSRATYSDWVLGLAKNRDVKASSFVFYDINALISHKFTDTNRLTLGYYRSNDKFQFANDFGFNWLTDLFSAGWKTSLGAKTGIDLNAAYSSYKSTSFDPEGTDAFSLDTGIDYFLANGGFFYRPDQNYMLRAGAEWITYSGRPERLESNQDQGTTVEIVEKEQAREIAVYLENEITLLPWLSTALGLRYTLFQNFGPYEVFDYQAGQPILEQNIVGSKVFEKGELIQQYSGLEPRASLLIRLGTPNSLKLSYNRTRQYIHSVTNSASPTPADLWQMGNKYFKPQISDNFSLGYFHNFDNNQIETSIEGFYKDIVNQVEYRDFAQLFLNDNLETELAIGRGRAYGMEFLLNKKSGDWTGWLSYAFIRSFVTVDSDMEEERINNGKEFPSNFDQPHKFNLVLKRKLGKKSSFSTSFTYITGRPITAISSSFVSGGTTIPIYTERNGERIPDFIRWDVGFTIAENIWPNRVVSKNRKFEDSLSISFYNVLNRRNAFSVFYQRAENQDKLVAKRLSVIGTIVPSITYHISF